MTEIRNKTFNARTDKMLLAVFVTVFALYTAFSCTYFVSGANSVRDDVVRLHILANSDCEKDQQVKLKVRDALLEKNALLLNDGVNTENAPLYFATEKYELLKTAQRVLKENGFNYSVKMTLEKEYFKTSQYGELTFPAGEYTALKVVLGEGEGHNWWCVMFPPLCIPAAGGDLKTDEKIADCLSESGEKAVSGGDKYVVKFKLLELYEELKNKVETKTK